MSHGGSLIYSVHLLADDRILINQSGAWYAWIWYRSKPCHDETIRIYRYIRIGKSSL